MYTSAVKIHLYGFYYGEEAPHIDRGNMSESSGVCMLVTFILSRYNKWWKVPLCQGFVAHCVHNGGKEKLS